MNFKRFLSFLKYTLLVAVVLTTVGISGCDDGDDGPTIFSGTVMAMIKSDQYKQSASVGANVALDSLVKYLEYYHMDVAIEAGENTLFAPSNEAFINLLALPGFPADIRQINPAIVTGVLSYHVVPGKHLKKEIVSGATFTTLYTGAANNPNDKIEVNSDGTLKTGSSNAAIQIVDADNQATTGVVHVTGTVLIPQTTGASLTPILGTVAGTVLLAKDFTNLAKVILAADASFTENLATGPWKVSTLLAMPISNATTATANVKGITFFAPPNSINNAGTIIPILTEATANGLAANPTAARAFLLNHLVISLPGGGGNAIGQYTIANAPATNPNGVTKFTNGAQITPMSGASKKITAVVATTATIPPNGVGVTNSQTVPPPNASIFSIVKADLGHNNGQVQVIAGALQ